MWLETPARQMWKFRMAAILLFWGKFFWKTYETYKTATSIHIVSFMKIHHTLFELSRSL